MTTVLGSVGATAITDTTDVSKVLGINLTGATTGTTTNFVFSQVANRDILVPDTGTTSSLVMTDSNQTINGIKSFTTPIAATSGGTGFSSYTTGDILCASSSTTFTKLNDVGIGNALISGGIGVLPSWGKIDLTTTVTGLLPANNGGTGINTSTATNGQLLIGNGSGFSLSTITQGTGVSVTNGSGTISIANTGVTSFQTNMSGLAPSTSTTGGITLSGTLGATSGGTSFSSYTTGDLLYASSSTTLAKLADVATGNALISGGVGVAPSWGKIDLTTTVTGLLPPVNGGTGINTSTATNGQLLIGNGSGLSLSTITQGTGINISNGSGTITITNSGVTSITGTANQVTASASTGAVTLSTPNTFIAPGTIQDTSGMKYSTSASVTAAGATQATATALTTSYVVVTTVASGTGVALPVATSGLIINIINRGANTLNV